MVGTGGVGKTSLAMTLAIAASLKGKKVAALTVDPSQRLSSVLNLSKSDKNLETHSSFSFNEKLDIFHIDTEESFFKFAAEYLNERSLLKLKENKIFNQITQNLRETHSFVSLYEMVNVFDSSQYDLVILDTPPSDQVMDFFQSPEKLLHFFSPSKTETKKQWYEWIKNKSASIIESFLSRLVGREFVSEMELFFEGISQIREQVQIISKRFLSIVKSESTKIILIYSSAQDKVREAQFLEKELRKNDLSIDTFVMNRAYSLVLDQSKEQSIQKDSREEELYNYFHQQKKVSLEIIKSMKKQSNSNHQNYVLIPEIKMNLQTQEDVFNFSSQVIKNWIEIE